MERKSGKRKKDFEKYEWENEWKIEKKERKKERKKPKEG